MFKISHGFKLDKSPSRHSTEALARLQNKPAHKPSRAKYDSLNSTCQKEKVNTTQTAEDKIMRETVHWTNSLRPLEPTMALK